MPVEYTGKPASGRTGEPGNPTGNRRTGSRFSLSPALRLQRESHIAVADRLVGRGAEQFQQPGDDCRLVARVALGPGARLHFEKVAVRRGLDQLVEVYVELDAAIGNQPAPPLLGHDVLGGGAEVFPVEPGRVSRRSEIARAEEEHFSEAILACVAGERQPRSLAGHRAVLVDEFVVAITQPPLLRVVERPVNVVLPVAAPADHRQLAAGEHLEHPAVRFEPRLDLHFEAFLLDCATYRNQLLEDADLTAAEEGIDAVRAFRGPA